MDWELRLNFNTMKTGVFLLLLVLPSALSAQSAKGGIFFGANAANWSGDDVLFAEDMAYAMNELFETPDFGFTSESRYGFNAGFMVDYKLAKFISIQPEVSYSQKGAKFSGTGTLEFEGDFYPMEADMVWQLDYVDLMLLLKVSLTKSNIKPYIIGGPGVGYLVYSKLNVKVTLDDETDTESSDADMFNKWDYHVNAGCGFDFSGSVRLEFRYYHFFKSATKETESEYNLFNNVKSINLVFCF